MLRNRFVRLRPAPLGLALALACAPSFVAVVPHSNDLCGETILEDLHLDHDLTCAGDGLIVGADDIRINLGGHTIAGSSAGAGIKVAGRTGVSISDGTLRNFAAGVSVMNSSAIVVKTSRLVENVDGIDLQSGSVGNTIKGNEFRANRARGIMLRGGVTHNVIKENTFSDDRVGILVFAGVDNILKNNVLSASLLAGIRVNVFATGNLVLDNTIVSNPVGVDLLATATARAIGNTFVENRIAMNACGIKGTADGNTFRENVLEGNVADGCL